MKRAVALALNGDDDDRRGLHFNSREGMIAVIRHSRVVEEHAPEADGCQGRRCLGVASEHGAWAGYAAGALNRSTARAS